jgi:hypothetical protein
MRLYPYLAEESGEGNTSTGSPPLDETKLSDMIKKSVRDSLETLASERSHTPPVETPNSPQTTDPWDEILEPRITRRTQQSSLKADAAEDKVDFYTSNYWLTEVDDVLPGDTGTEDLAKSKKDLRDGIEKTFNNLMKQGRATPRADIANFVLGEYIKNNKSTYVESVVKKSSTRKEQELQKARRGMDISAGNITNFTPEQLHKMPQEKIVEQFGDVSF